ncbi:MAG: prolyl oligopeptidase family serine peptidase [Anaerolineae bacterium]|nr:prolyl oligopeptidase family serine peptidase [Anaerolineae bacterium]
MTYRTLLILMVCLILLAGVAAPSAAQDDPTAWTVYELNLRAGPGRAHTSLALLPPSTPLVCEARSADSAWLLVRTVDGARRGWVAAGYLEYAAGVAVESLPVSEELLSPAAQLGSEDAPAAPVAPDPVAALNGMIISQELIYDSGHSQYYHIRYWSDGLRVAGFLGRPSGDGPFPALIYNRGGVGNRGALSGRELYPLVEAGYVVAASQYRGSGGSEGAESFGAGDVSDALNLIPLLTQMPVVDPARLGMIGFSRGGMVTYMALKEDTLRGTHAIKAAVTVGGIADLFMWAKDTPEIVRSVYLPLLGVPPAAAPDLFAARSAVYWPELITAPVLLLHGGADDIVSPQQSRALAERMAQAGRSAQLIVYEGDNHSLEGQLGGMVPAMAWLQGYFGRDGTDRTLDANWPAIQAAGQWFWEHGYR